MFLVQGQAAFAGAAAFGLGWLPSGRLDLAWCWRDEGARDLNFGAVTSMRHLPPATVTLKGFGLRFTLGTSVNSTHHAELRHDWTAGTNHPRALDNACEPVTPQAGNPGTAGEDDVACDANSLQTGSTPMGRLPAARGSSPPPGQENIGISRCGRVICPERLTSEGFEPPHLPEGAMDVAKQVNERIITHRSALVQRPRQLCTAAAGVQALQEPLPEQGTCRGGQHG